MYEEPMVRSIFLLHLEFFSGYVRMFCVSFAILKADVLFGVKFFVVNYKIFQKI